jgi:membrane-associated phospholipid phosphatase
MTDDTVRSPAHRLFWWREVFYVVAFYGVYSAIRNQFGSAAVPSETAYRHALHVIRIERDLHAFFEPSLQHRFLDWRAFIQFWNLFYGTFHFVVTTFCIFWLFRRFPDRYVRWRTTLAITTALALIGFAGYPLMPPRLLHTIDPSFHFVDTLKAYGGLWSFDSGAMAKVSNQYAAMPSLHFAWSTWCALVLVPTLPRAWLKAIAALYPVLTLFAIVVTGNHYWLDAAGGAAILGLGILGGTWWDRRTRQLGAGAEGPQPHPG